MLKRLRAQVYRNRVGQGILGGGSGREEMLVKEYQLTGIR